MQEQRQEYLRETTKKWNKIDDVVLTTNSHIIEKNIRTKLSDRIMKNYKGRMHNSIRAIIKERKMKVIESIEKMKNNIQNTLISGLYCHYKQVTKF